MWRIGAASPVRCRSRRCAWRWKGRRDLFYEGHHTHRGTIEISHRTERIRTVLRWLLAAIYLVAGLLHVLKPAPFLTIVPAWVPFPVQTVMLTGVCEIAGAIGLMTTRWRWWAGVLLAAYAVCVYPANVKHAIDGLAYGTNNLGWGYHLPRLAFQPVIVWWALFAGRVIDWPFRAREKRYDRHG